MCWMCRQCVVTQCDVLDVQISEGCPQLQDLDVGQCAKITDEGVCAVAKGCPHLTRLRLDQCGKVSVRQISAARSVSGGSVRQGQCQVDQCGKVSVRWISAARSVLGLKGCVDKEKS